MEVEAYTRESIEYDRPPQKVRGTLTTRWVSPLNYLQHLVNGVPVNADTVRPIDTGNANPEGCNQYKPCGTVSAERVMDRIKASPQFQGREVDWERYAERYKIRGEFHSGEVDSDVLKKLINSQWLSMVQAKSISEEEVKSKQESGKFNPVIITERSGGQMLVVDGNHSLVAAIRERKPITVIVPKDRAGQFGLTTNANPEGCNQYTGPGCGTGSHSGHHDSAMSLISTHLAAAGLSKEIADHYSGSASAVIRNMSPLSAQRLAENTMSVKFFPDNASLSRVLAGRYEFVARLLQGGASVGGCYDGKLGQLLLDGSHVLGGKPLPTPGVYAHEFGHAIDGPKGARISDDPDWHSAWSAELKTGIISKYAGTSPSEGFAEVARILHGTNLKVDEIEKHIPKCMAVWRSYGLLDNMPGHKMTANESEIIENAEPLLDELFSEGVDADGVIVDVLLPDAEDA
jgi:hypothetical protein